MHKRVSKLYRSLASLANAVRPGAQPQQLPQMPDCRGPPYIGALAALLDFDRGRRLHEYIDAKHRELGPVFRGRAGPTQAVFLGSAEVIGEVFRLEGPTPQHFVPEAWTHYNQMRNRKRGLLFMDGKEWLHYRRILNKIMLAKDSPDFMMKPCRKTAEDLVEKWKVYMNNNQTIPDLEHQLYQWSIEALLATLVGTPWPEYRRKILPELEVFSRTLSRIFEHSVGLARVPVRLAVRLGLPSWRGFVETADYALNTVSRFVDEMSRLEGAEDGMLRRMMNNGVEDEMLQRIVVDLIFAAGDTTAHSLQWLILLLSRNMKSQEKIYDTVQGLQDSELCNDLLLKGVTKETLRLYPIAPFITRILQQDTLLGGYPAYKGELLVISLYSCSHDEASFPRPNEFEPERWLRNEKNEFRAVNNPWASLPFAMGLRSCIGRKLAEVQMAITTAELLKNFRIDCLNKDNITLKLRMITVPSEPLQLRLTPRDKN